MATYLLKRLLLIIPTLFGIMLFSFVIIQFAPGGPVERMIAQLMGHDSSIVNRMGGGGGDGLGGAGAAGGQLGQGAADAVSSKYRGAQGLDPEFIKSLEKQFGFDKPAYERFFLMIKNYTCRMTPDGTSSATSMFRVHIWKTSVGFDCLDFGKSYFRDISVVHLIKEKLPVSISLGLWMTLLTYLISIPLGIRKAVNDGSKFDSWTSAVLVVGYAIPGFLFAVLLLILFAGSSFFQWFPSRGLYSDNWEQMSLFGKIVDYFWHLTLPLIAMAVGSFTAMTFLTKNSFLDEIRKQYVVAARAKGLNESQVLYGHVFRNAMLLIIAGFPAAFIGAFFSGALLIETIFSLDGLGLLSFESIEKRDYPVVFASLYIFSLVGLLVGIISDYVYTLVDPRIDFETREV
ncbi:MAG: ABC transporter permease subunit [Hyphomicrobium sp.]|nr:ABC transporter permease subunit [Hyphomicrobium sp.]